MGPKCGYKGVPPWLGEAQAESFYLATSPLGCGRGGARHSTAQSPSSLRSPLCHIPENLGYIYRKSKSWNFMINSSNQDSVSSINTRHAWIARLVTQSPVINSFRLEQSERNGELNADAIMIENCQIHCKLVAKTIENLVGKRFCSSDDAKILLPLSPLEPCEQIVNADDGPLLSFFLFPLVIGVTITTAFLCITSCKEKPVTMLAAT